MSVETDADKRMGRLEGKFEDLATKAELKSVKAELRIHRWMLGLLLIGMYFPLILDWWASMG